MAEEIKSQGNDISPESPNVVFGHKVCQTSEARWLCLEDIYEKFHRPNFYDIGGTYIDDVADYWFVYKTEQIANLNLLHLFVWNRHEESVLRVAASDCNDMLVDKKNDIVFLPRSLKQFNYNKVKEISKHYITTYSFNDIDFETLKGRRLYIGVSFECNDAEELSQEIIDNVKCNHDFSALLKNPVGSDFTIESADGHKFKVHKVLLAANSEVFKAMLKDEMAEGQTGYVRLIDVTKEDFQSVLEFIYSGTIVDMESSNFFNLLQLADRFNLRGLLDLCQYVLSQHLTIDNALETLIIADMYNANILKTAAMKVIKKNSSIVKTDMFKEMKNVELARELCEYLVPS
ncbi:BTB and MATH domain-containing protein 42 [Aphomia sociella]